MHLKGVNHGLRLRRTHAGPRRPFPVTASLEVKAPEEAAHIDVYSFGLQAIIDVQYGCTELPSLTVSWQVFSHQLPHKLRIAIADRLQQFHDSTKSLTFLNIANCFHFARSHWIELLCCIPEAVEHYEAVDVDGRTVRRIAIVSETRINVERGPELDEKQSLDHDLVEELRFIKRRFPQSNLDWSSTGELDCRLLEKESNGSLIFQIQNHAHRPGMATERGSLNPRLHYSTP